MNWKVRFKSKEFWVAFIPSLIILIQVIGALFGIELDLSNTSAKLLNVVNALFVVLTILGIVNDPTTKGFKDSEQAMTYVEPK